MRASPVLFSVALASVALAASLHPVSAQQPPALPPAEPDPLGSAAPAATTVAPTPYPSTTSTAPYPPPATTQTAPPAPPGATPATPAGKDLPSSKDAFPADDTKDAGPETLFDSAKDYAFGGFGGLNINYGRVAGTHGVFVGGEAAFIIDHALTFGGGGYGFVVPIDGEKYTGIPGDKFHFGYGGAIIRYHFRARKAVNFSVGTLIGAGGVAVGQDRSSNDTDHGSEFDVRKSEAMFVLEPQVGVYANVTRWFRVGASVGYRVVSGVETRNLSSSDLSGISAGGGLHFGWF